MKFLVTGASGFLGGAVCAELRRRGHEVAALVRRPGSEPPGTRRVAGDLADRMALRAARRRGSARLRHPPRGRDRLAARPARIARSTSRARGACSRPAPQPARPRFVFTSTVVTGDAGGALLDEDARSRSRPPTGARSRRASDWSRVGARRRDHPAEPRLRARRLVRGGVRQRGCASPGRFAVIGSGDNWWDVVRVEDVAARLRRRRRAGPGRARLPRRRRRADQLLRLRRA